MHISVCTCVCMSMPENVGPSFFLVWMLSYESLSVNSALTLYVTKSTESVNVLRSSHTFTNFQ